MKRPDDDQADGLDEGAVADRMPGSKPPTLRDVSPLTAMTIHPERASLRALIRVTIVSPSRQCNCRPYIDVDTIESDYK